MNLRQLEIFRAVMAAGTTSAAAYDLGVSQPAVSKTIRHTESSLGIILFERMNGRLVPTEEAQNLYREIAPLFQSLKSVQDRIYDIRDAKAGRVRLVAIPSMANSVIPHAIKAFQTARPGVQISLDIRRMEDIIEHIETNIAEVGVAVTFSERPSVIARPVHIGKMVCVIPQDHPLAELDVIRPVDLKMYPFIAMTRGTPMGKLIEKAFVMAGETLKWTVETRFCNTACALVESGAGVALVDEYVINAGSYHGLVVRPFIPNIPITAYVLYSKDRPLSNVAKLFIRSLEEKFLEYASVSKSVGQVTES
ncbi:LysR family transcriptional regulator [Photobacterium sp. GJ3]|uniref:LysR family transcriptional regulator n=1 Tax=Photobacterium sp. GJ3 TaxID=2829502 RepID=UPI001B8ABAFF|nr:LysR family transcriptional regulator [Photobacterium sp. GJ3]QUJ68540.1 LysR family transcriptional regulator [Photobacterium sp. GJ3]